MPEHMWRRRLFTGLCWFVALQLLLFAPLKFYPHGVGSYPSYFVKFVIPLVVLDGRGRR